MVSREVHGIKLLFAQIYRYVRFICWDHLLQCQMVRMLLTLTAAAVSVSLGTRTFQ